MMRKRPFPRSFTDLAAVAFLLAMIPVVYWFEIFLILPLHYGDDRPILVWFHTIVGTFILLNLVGNFVAVYLTDTSIQGHVLSVQESNPRWRFCVTCETLTPPRSWHCSVCDTCILKRDHHCNFTACCIGHYNQRYFAMFVLYLSVATIYCTYFNAVFLWKSTTFSIWGILKLVFPLAIFMFGSDMSIAQFYRLICVITIIGMIASTTIGLYHFINMSHGVVMHERAKGIKEYDLGLKENLRQVFGERWYLTWVTPFVISNLPCDGIQWEKVKQISNKSK